jgi:hypothetical protein
LGALHRQMAKNGDLRAAAGGAGRFSPLNSLAQVLQSIGKALV